MLVTLKEILKIAEEKNIAVGAFNAPNLESLQAVMSAAEEVQLPVIIQFAPVHETFNLLADMGPLMMEYAKRVSVPVCVHLDHGDTVERVQQALDMGFTGVMIDGSTLPYEENAALSKKVVEMAHAAGASVEAELGSMGRTETGSGEGTGANDETKIYTDPVLAKDFVAAGADAIIGAHPHCLQGADIMDGVPVFYSLGNFYFSQEAEMPDDYDTAMAQIIIDDSGTLSARLLPCHFSGGNLELVSDPEKYRQILADVEGYSDQIAFDGDGYLLVH